MAILVDGGFYLHRANYLFGQKPPGDRASELVEYCSRHLKGPDGKSENRLYRIFYYDCPPIETPLYHPLLKKQVLMGRTERHEWGTGFLSALASKRKLAIRLGVLQERESAFRIKDKSLRKILNGEMKVEELGEQDFKIDLVQKGVDMKIGLDIATLSSKKQVTQIVLISGDSDFVPAAKHARREGIDFILDPMWQKIRPDLAKHIDGLHSCTPQRPTKATEPLCVRG